MALKFCLKLLFASLLLTVAFSFFGAPKASAFNLNPDPPLWDNNGPPPYGIPWAQKADLMNCNGQPYGISPAFWQWLGVFGANGRNNITVPFGSPSATFNFNWASAICNGSGNDGIPGGNSVPNSSLRVDFVEVFDVATGAPIAASLTNWAGQPVNGSVLTLNNGSIQGDYRLAVLDFNYSPVGGFRTRQTVRLKFYNKSINQFDNGTFGCIALPRNQVNGWDYGACNYEIIELDMVINVDPFGEIGQSGCNLGNWDNNGQDAAIVGWAQDLDYWPTKIAVYADKRAYYPGMPAATLADLVPIGQYTANHQPRTFGPNPKPPPPSWNDWWIVPTRDTASLNDAYRHKFIINVVDMDANGNEVGQRTLGDVIIGPCEQPKCGAYTGPGTVEANVPFNAKANFTYAAGSRGLAVQNDMGLDINNNRVATVSNRYWANGNSPPLGINGQPVPPGATISNEVEANNVVLPNAGTYPVRWRIQWIVPPDPTLLNTLRNNHTAGGPYDYYQAGPTFYGTLDCPSGGATQQVGTRPYAKVYGNDIAAGGGFGASCTLVNDRAAILTLLKETTTGDNDAFAGSSSELGAFALGEIYDFYSAGTHSPRRAAVASSPTHGLTFGNFGDPTINSVGNWNATILDGGKTANYGGKGGQSRCAPDYYSLHPAGTPSTPFGGTHWNLGTTGTAYIKPNPGFPAYFFGKGSVSGSRIIFVDGDAYIGPAFFDPSPNITYAGYGSASQIPSVYIVAQGNIYISPGTTNVSGVFIAQPKPGVPNSGTIYTCATAAGPVDQASISGTCNNQLTVNGAFIANRIKLMRTRGTLKDAAENELWTSGNIAEVFKASPELYLGTPPQALKKDGAFSRYDSITSLPPIL